MSKTKEILIDSFKNHREDSKWLILTFDLKNGSSSDYRIIDNKLQDIGLKKGIRAKMKKNKKNVIMGADLPKNIYISKVKWKGSINWMRDRVDRLVRKILDSQCKRGDMCEYRYFIFISQEWSWSLCKSS
jgi:hypothetical protein